MLRLHPPILLVVAALAVALSLPAVAQVPDHIANAPGIQQHPDEDGLVVQQTDRWTLAADGKLERHHEVALKMLTSYLTRHDHFDPLVDWNDARATMRVDQARTYMVDGTVVDAAANSLVPNTDAAFNHAVPYVYMRQMVVAHVGVEHGATSITAYTIDDRAPSGVPLWGVVELPGIVPILDHWITVEVPEGTDLHHCGVFCELTPETETKDGLTSYTFHRSGVPTAHLDEASHGHQGVARMAFSTAADWAAVRTFLEGRVEPALSADPAVQSKVDEVIDSATLTPEKVALIHAFVVDGVQAVHWPAADFDYAARPAADVLDSSVGHELDKSVLLAAMLRQAGIPAVVTLVSSDRVIAADVPAPGQLDQVWVRAQVGDKEVFLHPDASCNKRNKTDLAGRWVLPLDGAATEPVQRPGLQGSRNRATLRAEVTIEGGDHQLQISGSADVDLGLSYNPVVTFDRGSDGTGKLAGRVAGSFGGAHADSHVVARQTCELTALRTEFSGGTVDVPLHGLVRLSLPRVPGALSGAALQTYRNTRTMPLQLPGPLTERVELVLDLPDGYELAYAPEPVALANAAGSVRRTVEIEDGTLTVTTVLLLDTDLVSPAEYLQLRALFDRLEGDADATILLQRQD
jgi:Domain of Unknown Function with PDB structure (DUF3858)/Domain of Unknown Function with PDB structure (DUF3857)